MIKIFFSLVSVFLFSGSEEYAVTNAYVVRDIKSFGAKGDGITNDFQAFKKAADFFNARKGNGTLIISKGLYVVGNQSFRKNGIAYYGDNIFDIKNCKDLKVQGTGGAKILLAPGMKVGAFNPETGKAYQTEASRIFTESKYMASPGSVLHFLECVNIEVENIRIDGNNGKVVKGGKFGDTGFQVWGYGVVLTNCKNVKIKKVSANYCVTDGLLVKNKNSPDSKITSDNISIDSSEFIYNGRQGLSWTGGAGLRVSNSVFANTGMGNITTMPSAGVDIEPEDGDIATNGVFVNCSFKNNAGCGVVADSGPSSNMKFENCTFESTQGWTAWVRKPGFSFLKCTFKGSIVHAYDSETDKDATLFKNCTFDDIKINNISSYGKFMVEINHTKRVAFIDCIFNSRNKDIFWIEGRSDYKTEEKPRLLNNVFNIYFPNKSRPIVLGNRNYCVEKNSSYNILGLTEKEFKTPTGNGWYFVGTLDPVSSGNKYFFIPSKKVN